MDTDELYKEYLKLRDQYQSLISPDPELIKASPEAGQLLKQLGRAWTVYYFTKYPSGPPKEGEYQIV